jgi:hypothetical protein
MRKIRRPSSLILLGLISLAACSAPPATATAPSIPTVPEQTATPAATATPEASPTPALLPLEIIEIYEHPIPNLSDPSSGVTNVEVLIRNPNDFHVSIGDDAEVRFLNSAGEVVYTNPSPVFFIWQGEWMTPGQTGALQVCMCLESEGSERPEWESLELIAPLEITERDYTTDVEVTAEFVLLEEVLHGYSGPGVDVTLTNTSDQALEAIAKLVFAYDASGRYVGMASFGNAVVTFREDIETQQRGIQPGDTAHGFEESEIDYLGNERLTYEVQAIGIILLEPTPAPTLSAALSEWKGIPIMPGALGGIEADGAYQYTTMASLEEIRAFYETELAALGYTLESADEGGAEYMLLIFTDGSVSLQVGIASVGGFNAVVLILN